MLLIDCDISMLHFNIAFLKKIHHLFTNKFLRYISVNALRIHKSC